MTITIKRDHTFVCEGETFTVSRLGPYGGGDDAWTVQRESGRGPRAEYYRLSEVREDFEHGLPWWAVE